MAIESEHDVPQGEMLSWAMSDPEQKLGFAGGQYTRVNYFLCFLMAGLLTCAFFGILYPVRNYPFAVQFYRSGSLPVSAAIIFFSCWSASILFFKTLKLRLQRKVLAMQIVPQESDFILSPTTIQRVEDRIRHLVDDPKKFILTHRISFAISNMRNLGRIGDVAEIFKTQADYDEASMETSYMALSVFVWAIPVLGFIGTVLGLSESIGEFGGVLQSATELSEIKDNLQAVTGGLATAFETTLQGLVAALLVQLGVAWSKKSELEFLDECNEYCARHVVSKLRLLPLEDQTSSGS